MEGYQITCRAEDFFSFSLLRAKFEIKKCENEEASFVRIYRGERLVSNVTEDGFGNNLAITRGVHYGDEPTDCLYFIGKFRRVFKEEDTSEYKEEGSDYVVELLSQSFGGIVQIRLHTFLYLNGIGTAAQAIKANLQRIKY